MKELKDCPFCGHEPDIMNPDCIYPINDSKTIWELTCAKSDGGCGCSILGDSKDDAISRWNIRFSSK